MAIINQKLSELGDAQAVIVDGRFRLQASTQSLAQAAEQYFATLFKSLESKSIEFSSQINVNKFLYREGSKNVTVVQSLQSVVADVMITTVFSKQSDANQFFFLIPAK